MHALDWLLSVPLLAYSGLGSGLELLPYFAALMGFLAAALLAIVQRPIVALTRWFWKAKNRRGQSANEAPLGPPQPISQSSDIET